MGVLSICSLLILNGCHSYPVDTIVNRQVTINVTVPEDTGTVYIAGNLDVLGPWDASVYAVPGTGTVRSATLVIPEGHYFEFKFTLGSWDIEALTAEGEVPENHAVTVTEDTTLSFTVAQFGTYE